MTLLHWWITILEDQTPAEAAVYSLIGAVTLVVLYLMVRWFVMFWRYVPFDEGVPADPRPIKVQPPRAAGCNHRRIS